MTKKTLGLDEGLYRYLVSHSVRESSLLRRLREETSTLAEAQMQISPEQGQFMAMLVELIGARRALEIGTFTGYSALCVAQALPDDGELVACDISREWTEIGRRYWLEGGVANKIRLQLAPALKTLEDLNAEGQQESFDFAFIDADKANYDAYYEACLKLIRPGGLIAVDNVLWGGSVIDSHDHSEDTQAIRALNEKLHQDTRVSISLVPIADGLYLARKR